MTLKVIFLLICAQKDIQFPFSQCYKAVRWVNTFSIYCKSMAVFVLVQFLLFDLQLQHDGVELHVQIVGSLQLPLVVLPDVQRVSARREQKKDIN